MTKGNIFNLVKSLVI